MHKAYDIPSSRSELRAVPRWSTTTTNWTRDHNQGKRVCANFFYSGPPRIFKDLTSRWCWIPCYGRSWLFGEIKFVTPDPSVAIEIISANIFSCSTYSGEQYPRGRSIVRRRRGSEFDWVRAVSRLGVEVRGGTSSDWRKCQCQLRRVLYWVGFAWHSTGFWLGSKIYLLQHARSYSFII